MWYIITIEPHDFLELKVEQEDVNFNFEGRESGISQFNVNQGDRLYSIELLDDSYEPYYLSEIYKINPSGFTCINHATVLLKWKDEAEKLKSILKKVLYPKDKFAVFQVSNIIASNFLPVEYLSQQIKR